MREGEQVSPLELFFALVFVLAITQCTQLMSYTTWEGVAQGPPHPRPALVVVGRLLLAHERGRPRGGRRPARHLRRDVRPPHRGADRARRIRRPRPCLRAGLRRRARGAHRPVPARELGRAGVPALRRRRLRSAPAWACRSSLSARSSTAARRPQSGRSRSASTWRPVLHQQRGLVARARPLRGARRTDRDHRARRVDRRDRRRRRRRPHVRPGRGRGDRHRARGGDVVALLRRRRAGRRAPLGRAPPGRGRTRWHATPTRTFTFR